MAFAESQPIGSTREVALTLCDGCDGEGSVLWRPRPWLRWLLGRSWRVACEHCRGTGFVKHGPERSIDGRACAAGR